MHMPSVSVVLTALLPLVAAHGKVAVATGDAGGNGTALGIQGGVIPGAGSNKVTEPDTTVFKGANADACGQTKGQGQNDIEAGTKSAMALSGSTLPQVSSGGSLSGTLHIVTSDGAGPYKAMINADGTGQTWTEAEVTQQVPGTKGNIKKSDKRWYIRALENMGIVKRATNINEDYPFKVAMPSDLACTGNIAGQANTCLVKLVNPSNAGPFGGCVPVQQAGASAAAPAAAAATGQTAAAAGKAAARRAVALRA